MKQEIYLLNGNYKFLQANHKVLQPS